MFAFAPNWALKKAAYLLYLSLETVTWSLFSSSTRGAGPSVAAALAAGALAAGALAAGALAAGALIVSTLTSSLISLIGATSLVDVSADVPTGSHLASSLGSPSLSSK